MHLKADELVDLAEGTRPESSAPHLVSCERCRRQWLEMRGMMSAAADADVPEPSPLFWDHLSERVRDAVSAEAAPDRPWRDAATWRRVLVPAWAAAVASILLVVSLGSRLMAPQPPAAIHAGNAQPLPSPAIVTDASASTDVLEDAASDDASLLLVAGLTSAINLDAAGDAGFAPAGSADHAVTHLDDDELRELQRLLKQELAPSGASS
jgi:hypothetical protein